MEREVFRCETEVKIGLIGRFLRLYRCAVSALDESPKYANIQHSISDLGRLFCGVGEVGNMEKLKITDKSEA